MNSELERELVESAKHDTEAFGRLYDYYYAPILRYILRGTSDQEQAEDLCANVFYKAMAHMSGYEWQQLRFSSWLYKIAGNEVNL